MYVHCIGTVKVCRFFYFYHAKENCTHYYDYNEQKTWHASFFIYLPTQY